MLINKRFADLIKDKMKEKGLSYGGMKELSGISKTYFTDILVKGNIPSRKKIEEITSALDIDPENIREYRILKIQESLRDAYLLYSENELETIEETVFSKKPLNKREGAKFRKRTYRLMKGDKLLDLTELPIAYKEFIIKMYNEIRNILNTEEIEE